MTKIASALAALMLCSAAIGASAQPLKMPARDVFLSAAPDELRLKSERRVDFVPQHGNRVPPFMG